MTTTDADRVVQGLHARLARSHPAALSDIDRRLVAAFERLMLGRPELTDGRIIVTNICVEAGVSPLRTTGHQLPQRSRKPWMPPRSRAPRSKNYAPRSSSSRQPSAHSEPTTPPRCANAGTPSPSTPTRSRPSLYAIRSWRPTSNGSSAQATTNAAQTSVPYPRDPADASGLFDAARLDTTSMTAKLTAPVRVLGANGHLESEWFAQFSGPVGHSRKRYDLRKSGSGADGPPASGQRLANAPHRPGGDHDLPSRRHHSRRRGRAGGPIRRSRACCGWPTESVLPNTGAEGRSAINEDDGGGSEQRRDSSDVPGDGPCGVGRPPGRFRPPARLTTIGRRRFTDRAAGAGWSMEEQPTTLGIRVVVGPDAEAEEVAEATLQLRRELLDLDVDAVELPRAGDAPPGSRAVELAALGALLVTAARSQLLGSVVAAVRSWVASSPKRSIKLELGGDVLELTGVSSAEQRRLTDEWLRRHESR